MNQDACGPITESAATSELAKLDEGVGHSMAPEAPDDEAAKIHVLLVEDEFLIAEIIGEALIDAGHAVHSVSNAEDALAHMTSGSRVDVLFTDINLPGAMDGAALAESARKALPGLAVIYASGRWGLLDKLRGFPNAAILQKPYSPARACETVLTLAAAIPGKADAQSREALALAL